MSRASYLLVRYPNTGIASGSRILINVTAAEAQREFVAWERTWADRLRRAWRAWKPGGRVALYSLTELATADLPKGEG